MIRYSLICAKDHEFDGWFRDSAAYDEQQKSGALSCPVCGSGKVRKAIMAPAVGSGSREPAAPEPVAAAGRDAKLARLLEHMRRLRRYVEENADYVGREFAEEARRIHYEETEPRGIYGETTREEAQALIEEGIEIAPLPILPEDNN